MTDKERRFAEEYPIDHCKAKAAIRAGYSKASAASIGCEIYQREDIQKAIKERQKELTMDAEEATKRVSDNARTRLNDFMKEEVVWESTYEKKSVQALIDEIQLEIEIDREFAQRGGFTEEQRDKIHELNDKRKLDILRYQIELEKNPKAHRIVKSEPRPVKKATVDLIKLAKADQKGAMKKISFNERGLPSVELYSAENALETILKLNGKLINKVDHTTGGKSFGDFLMETDE